MNLFVVRGENGGEPESYLLGVYNDLGEAMVRMAEAKDELEIVWIEEVELGVSTFLSNR